MTIENAAARLGAIIFLSFAALAPAGGAAEQPPNREQALRMLASPDAVTRRAAASRLGEVGRMVDAAALVKALRDSDGETRTAAEAALWEIWGRSGNTEIDALYRRGVEQMSLGAADDAIETFTLIIHKQPDFAEGWNKRATLYYSIGEFKKSLRDCDEVIRRNPLHFGALSGYGLIYVELDQPERALVYFRRALKVNPNMQGVARNIELLQKQMDEQRKNYI